MAYYGGTSGSENQTGTSSADTIYGGAGGNDTLLGAGGNDLIAGGSGADNLQGQDGDDTLQGGSGNDSISGGTGNDLVDERVPADGEIVVANWILGGPGSPTYMGELAGLQFNTNNEGAGDTATQTISTTPGIDYTFSFRVAESGSGSGSHTILVEIVDDNDVVIGSQSFTVTNGQVANVSMDYSATTDGTTIRITNTNVSSTTNSDVIVNQFVNGPSPSGDDTISGGDGNDTVFAAEGNDSVDGGGGDDQLYGGLGNDTIDGSSGNDVIDERNAPDAPVPLGAWTLGGSTQVFGGTNLSFTNNGAGDSASQSVATIPGVEYSLNFTLDEIGTASGSHTVVATIRDSNGNIIGTETVVVGNGQSNTVSIDFVATTAGTTISFVNTALTGTNIASDVVVTNISVTGGAPIAGDDSLIGGDGADTIYADTGNDTLLGGSGNDALFGGDGQDSLDGGAGNDSLRGDEGNDTITMGGGNDTVFGGTGDDTVTDGTPSPEAPGTLTNGGFGAGMTGWTVLNPSGGSAPFVDPLFSGSVRINWNEESAGGDGVQQVVATTAGSTYTLTVNASESGGGTGNHTVLVEVLDAGGNVLASISGVALNNDILLPLSLTYVATGTATTIRITNPSSTDTINSDVLIRDVTNTLVPAGLDDFVDGGLGNDTISTGAGNDTIIGDVGNDSIAGGDGNDTMQGNAGNDSLLGDAGNDSIHGGTGNDTFYGGLGNDQLFGGELAGELGSDIMYGDDGDDGVYGSDGNDSLFGGIGNDSLGGGYGNDEIHGDAGNDYILDDPGNDLVYGGDGSDTVIGGDGEDTYYGGIGNDSITDTGLGNDVIYGDAGDDTVSGGLSNDTVYGGVGNDSLDGGQGNDSIAGGDGNDGIFGGAGVDYINGDAGNDTVYGGDGADTVAGSDGSDLLHGDNGDDAILGGADAGNDTLYGGAGNDLLTGEAGNDQLYGGVGNDTLIFTSGSDTLTGGSGDDLIYLAGGTYDSVHLADFGAGETAGANGSNLDNDFVDLTTWYNSTTLEDMEAYFGVNFGNALQALAFDAADGTLNWIAESGGPTVTFTLADTGVMDTEHTGVTCFARGTMIESDRGPVVIEELQRGDRIETLDHGFQTIRWIGSRRILADELEANPKLRPIRIQAGALGRGLPVADVLVSPQHRVLVSSKIAERMFGMREVLVPARQLLQIAGIDVAEDVDFVEYFHFLFDRHQIVFAEGAAMETLFTGIEALKAVSPEARREIFEILPDLMKLNAETLPEPARPIREGRIVRKMVSRHVQNGIPLINR
jgi:Ca2+-binding RTX toxin-like protein